MSNSEIGYIVRTAISATIIGHLNTVGCRYVALARRDLSAANSFSGTGMRTLILRLLFGLGVAALVWAV